MFTHPSSPSPLKGRQDSALAAQPLIDDDDNVSDDIVIIYGAGDDGSADIPVSGGSVSSSAAPLQKRKRAGHRSCIAKKPKTRVSWGLATVFPSDQRISDQSWTEPLDDKCRFRHEYKPLPFDEQHAVLGEPTYEKGTPDHRAIGRRTAHRERYVGWRSHLKAMFRASVLARILDSDADTQGTKKRSIGGWPMLIRPDGNYELYD